ncbi:MAG TPA: acireductone synthase [Nitrospiraceae bacterium]|nr:acireductone synthase [Nitrospiraceae bacterium]
MVRYVLMDIEGTLIPLAFVREVLFPFAKHRLATFLHGRRHDPDVLHWTVACQDVIEQETGNRPPYEKLPVMLADWMDQDRKLACLKALQGMIWDEGYRQRAFVPELYDDVLPALTHWREQGIRLGIYSSGSEQAQRLLFAHTNAGDMTSFFEHFFDTWVGEKKAASSYRTISGQIGLHPRHILFLSDAESELDAAALTGFGTAHIVRPGTDASNRYPVYPDLRCLLTEG